MKKHPKPRKLKTEKNKHGMAVQKAGVDKREPGQGLAQGQGLDRFDESSSSGRIPVEGSGRIMPSILTSSSTTSHPSDRPLPMHHSEYERRDEMDENSSSSGSSSDGDGDGDGDDSSQSHHHVTLTTAIITTTTNNTNTMATTASSSGNITTNSTTNSSSDTFNQRASPGTTASGPSPSPGISADTALPVPRDNNTRGGRAKAQGLPPPDFL